MDCFKIQDREYSTNLVYKRVYGKFIKAVEMGSANFEECRKDFAKKGC